MSDHTADCPDPCRHDNECPHGKSNVAGETCHLCEGTALIPEIEADWKVIRRLADAIAECVDNTVNYLLEEYDLIEVEDEEVLMELTDRVMDLAVGRTQ